MKSKLKIEYINSEKLCLLEGNPRKQINADTLNNLKPLIKVHGFQNPLQVYEENQGRYSIICGNHRFLAAQDLGMKEFPCIIYHGSREMALARAISDNKSGEWTEWDYPALKDMIAEIDNGELDMELTGFTEEELAALFDIDGSGELKGEDDAPKVPQTPKTKLGDLYQLGDHFLLCGDATARSAVERLMDGVKADMVFTDPPYGVDYQGGHLNPNRKKLIGDDGDIYSAAIPIIASVTDGPCYTWFVGSKALTIYSAISKVGEIHALIIWHKTNASYAAINAQYKSRHESLLYWKPKGKALRWCGPTDERTLWEMKRDARNDMHPTQKPVELAERAIGNHKAKSVLDLFGGSGSTMIACEKLNRKCYMMEIDPGYCDVIVERYKNLFPEKEVCLLYGAEKDVIGAGSIIGQTG